MAASLRTLTVRHDTLPLARPFRIARGVRTAAEVIVVEIAEDGRIGRGEGVPYPRYGESVNGSIAAIEARRSAIEAGADRQAMLAAMPAGAARNAVDCALWDLEMRLAGTNAFAALGLASPPAPVATALTVGLDTPDAMREAARDLAQAPLIKVKVDASDPAAQLRAVREVAPQPRMIVDPNESWTTAEIETLQDLMLDLRVDLLEQPIHADRHDELRSFASAIPIAADESIHTVADLDLLPDGYGVVNIKLDKTGGLTAAIELADAAQARGLGVMTGCMISSSLSIAPAFAIAGKSGFVDLDGPLWLAEDRTGGVRCANGIMQPPQDGFWGGAA